jgi:hypothetical protein
MGFLIRLCFLLTVTASLAVAETPKTAPAGSSETKATEQKSGKADSKKKDEDQPQHPKSIYLGT